MKTMHVGELKARFSEVLDLLRRGEEILISVGRKNEHVGVLVPYSDYKARNSIKLGLLAKNSGFSISDDFELSDLEILGE
jgi:prevent-host-death family protein